MYSVESKQRTQAYGATVSKEQELRAINWGHLDRSRALFEEALSAGEIEASDLPDLILLMQVMFGKIDDIRVIIDDPCHVTFAS